MNPTGASTFDPDRWREHAGALRALARRLVADSGAAEDLVQQTMLRAVERPPAGGSSIRGWLRAVLRNEARQMFRTERRRKAREARLPVGGEQASTSDLVAQLDGQLLLASAVKALDPIHREAILLRFFEDLPPRRIAQRLGLPVRTVESRLQRALLRLREELDETDRREGRSWIAVLVPLIRPRIETGIGVLGIMSLKMFSLSLIGVALLASVAFLWHVDDPSSQEAVRAAGKPEASADSPHVESEPAWSEASVVREAEKEVVDDLEVAKTTPSESNAARGVLLDSSGVGIPDIHLIGKGTGGDLTTVTTTTRAGGWFELAGTPGRYEIEIADSQYLLLVEGAIDLDPPAIDENGTAVVPPDARPSRQVFIAERAGAARGSVADPAGVPIGGANLGFELPERLRVLFGAAGERAALKTFATRSNADGRFEFPRVPAIDGLQLLGAKVGFHDAKLVVNAADLGHLSLVLERVANETQVLEGVVRGANQEPLGSAYVAFGEMPARTNSEGKFRFEYDAKAPPTRIVALVKGQLPAVDERPADGSNPWPAYLELRIDGAPKRIAGSVFGVDGKPLVGGSVMLAQSTRIASWNSGFWCAENLVRDDETLRIDAATDREGRFVLDGLLDQWYALRVVDGSRALLVDAGTFQAGDENVVIRLSADRVNARIEGRVIDRAGQPIAQAEVRVQCQMLAFQDANGGKYYDSMTGSRSTTDAAGRFVLEQVPIAEATLEVAHESLFGYEGVAVPERAYSGIFEITVFRRCEVRVEVDPNANYQEFELADEHGKKLLMLREEQNKNTYLDKAGIFAGKSEVLATSDAAVKLILRTAEGTTTARDISLSPAGVNVLR